jgi:hypothetical protein
MRFGIGIAISAMTALIAGCSDGSPRTSEQTVLNGPHHGTTLQLPEQKGFVELVNEPQPKDRRNTEPTSLVAYFLKSDARTPLDPVPTDVSFAVDSGGGRGTRGSRSAGEAIALTAEPKSDDPAGAGRFASKPGPYQLSNLRGTLSAKIEGQAVSVMVAGGR